MNYSINGKYLIFPVNTLSSKKELSFKANGKTVYQLNIKLDNYNPDFYAYIDVSRFAGQEVEISVNPEMEIRFSEADTMDMDNLYSEPMRPQIHFTTKNGWINDPNGLIYLNGTYHMFYQYNPADTNWDNMHWGHAQSPDLIHWEEKDIALFPDDRGAMYSGSAVYDEKNLLGKGNAALIYYTTTSPFCQHMSYSVDNFKTIEHYSKKPVVPHIAAKNRDPKVIFCDELNCYIMALYLDKDLYCLLKSDNLTDWTELQRIRLTGDLECPDIFPLTDDAGNRKWVIMGASDKYLVGSFDSGIFVPDQDVMPLHYGISSYAGQTFSNLPGGRVVRVVWDRWHMPSFNFNGQMGIPVELSLSRFNEICYLEANPVRELETIYHSTERYENITVSPQNNFNVRLNDSPCLFKLKSDLPRCGTMIISIFGRIIEVDFPKNELRFGDCKAPVSISGGDFDLTVIADRCSMEIFSDGGKAYMSCVAEYAAMDRNIPYLTITSDSEHNIKETEITSLDSIWN